MKMTLDRLRRLAASQSLFPPTTLKRALQQFGFVQADPIRAPARAQDLILRHRVKNYRAGDLERNYQKLGVEEDFFINYGFVTREMQIMMHPRFGDLCPGGGGLTPGPQPAGSGPSSCWSSSANGERFIPARWTTTSPTAG